MATNLLPLRAPVVGGGGAVRSSNSSDVDEWYPPGGVTTLEFDAVFRRTSVRGVAFDVPRVIK